MPSTLSAPGIYIEELRGGPGPIVGVSTSFTAFVDWYARGPVGAATRVDSFEEFTRLFGGLHSQSCASYGVMQYFLNGGATAWIVRIGLADDKSATAKLKDEDDADTLTVTAAAPGGWGNGLRVAVTSGAADAVNLVVGEVAADGTIAVREIHRNLPAATADLIAAVNDASDLVLLTDIAATPKGPEPVAGSATGEPLDPTTYVGLTGGVDATVLKADGTANDATKLAAALEAGLAPLTRIEPAVFNLLCVPAAATLGDGLDELVDKASKFCEDNFAFLVVDPPPGAATDTGAEMAAWAAGTDAPTGSKNAAIYWPRLTMPDPLANGIARDTGPSGAVAGIFARTDATRGVWKAPAGIEATLRGADLSSVVNDADSARLNPIGVNVLRTFPVVGNVVWGARTLVGADLLASEWKYVPVRRTALYIEQSLRAGLKWVVFEPNDEPLWSQIRLNVGAFLQDLFRKQAFQGATPRDAYFVRCDRNTTTQGDIDRGVVNVLVGFAPLKPAEFVVIQIQQMAGQAAG
ncbi:phage tail sheath subtilisin-like domain-containing protein [Kribbella sp. NBC_00709]|uniref:phage tail sheath family protein n=1 Tax=Kribbella sp. NBC_00709 TaxID=2975972 RepID=UPI002E286FE5|nr:phage tail sheath C-terminal domain-containing protein [Kribbella sp. NBC_00709]